MFGVSSTTTTNLRAVKATDPSSSWSNVGTDFAWTGGSDFLAIDTVQIGDVVHIVTQNKTDAATTGAYLLYHKFDMSTDAWTTTNESIKSNYEVSSTSKTVVAVAARSNGDIIVLYEGAKEQIMGAARGRTVYARKEGSTWTIDTSVDDAAGIASSYHPHDAIIGADNRVHFFWEQSSTNLRTRSLSSTNVLSGLSSAIGTYNRSRQGLRGTSYVSGSVTRILMPCHASTANQAELLYGDSADTLVITAQTDITGTSDIKVEASSLGLAADGTTAWAAFIENTTDDLRRMSRADGGSFGASSLVYDNTGTNAGIYVKCSVFTRGGNVVLAVSWFNNTTSQYTEYVISTSGIALNATASGTATATSALTTAIRPASNATATATATAALTTAIRFASSVSATGTATSALSTQITPAASVAALGTATAGLTTQITLAASVQAVGTATGSLAAPAAALESAVSGTATATAVLSTQIALGASAAGVGTTTSALTTAIRPAASAAALASATAALSTNIRFAASVGGVGTASAALTTAIALSASASATATATAAMAGTAAALAAAAIGTASASAALTTQIALDAIAQAQASAAADLTAPAPQAAGSGHGFEMGGGFEPDPRLWWLRKPKAVPREKARKQVAEVAQEIRRIVVEQVADAPKLLQSQPTKDQRAEVKAAIAPLVAQMPGFDWMAMYQALLAQEIARQAIAKARQDEQDEDDALILLMA